MSGREEIGRRIARQRRRRGLSQQVLAGLVGRSESWLSQVERGKRAVDRHSVLVELARVLRVDVAYLTYSAAGDDVRTFQPAEAISDAMFRYDGLAALRPDQVTGEDLVWLRMELHQVNRLYQATEYEGAGQRLPGLIAAVERTRQPVAAGHLRETETLRALIYQAAATTLARVGQPGIALTAVERSLAAAEGAERPMLGLVGAYRLGYILIKMGRADRAHDLALRAADSVRDRRGSHPIPMSILGALYLVAATAAAAQFDRAAVDAHLAAADHAAETTGDRNDFWTAFGPTNVKIHRLSTAVAFGDPKLAQQAGESLDLSRLAPGLVGRRAQVHLDLARAYGMQHKDAAAVNTLIEAEQLSPELVRYDHRTHDLLTQLMRREHRPSTPQLRGLAQRAGVI